MLPGLRFRKGLSLFPGVRLNISKSGISTSIGKRGATVNLSSRGTSATVGAPGTGLSYRRQLIKGGRGYYGFLIILAAFYVLYQIYIGMPRTPPQPVAAPVVQQAPATVDDEPVEGVKPVKHHRRRRHKTDEN